MSDQFLRVNKSGRYFETTDGTPWFWLGDTAWSMFTAYTMDEAARYLTSRARMGFTLIQVSPVFDGGTGTEIGESPNPNPVGVQPWANHNPLQPNEAFWKTVDAALSVAREHGLYLGLLPAWGSFMVNSKMITKENARAYGRWLGERYKNVPNIVWINGGDRRIDEAPDVWPELSHGLVEGDGGAHPITFHPGCELQATSAGFHHEPWLAANMIQTWGRIAFIPPFMAADYKLTPPKPLIMAEGGYEEGPEYPQPITPLEIRKQAWWSYLCGGFYTYGHNDMWRRNPTWEKSLQSEGARNMRTLREFFNELDWWNLIPTQEIFIKGQGEGFTFNAAARSREGTWALVYLSSATTVELWLNGFRPAQISASWFNPATGERTAVEKIAHGEVASFTTPSGWEDAVLKITAD